MVVVLGTARSGSSLVAGVIVALGYDPGARVIPPDETNPRGHFEDLELWTLVWRDRVEREVVERYLAATDHPRRLIKLPQLADYLPLRFPAGTRFVWSHRALDASLASAERAYGEGEVGAARIRRYYDRVASFLGSRPHLRVEHDAALADPPGTVAAVAAHLGCPVTEEALGVIDTGAR